MVVKPDPKGVKAANVGPYDQDNPDHHKKTEPSTTADLTACNLLHMRGAQNCFQKLSVYKSEYKYMNLASLMHHGILNELMCCDNRYNFSNENLKTVQDYQEVLLSRIKFCKVAAKIFKDILVAERDIMAQGFKAGVTGELLSQ